MSKTKDYLLNIQESVLPEVEAAVARGDYKSRMPEFVKLAVSRTKCTEADAQFALSFMVTEQL